MQCVKALRIAGIVAVLLALIGPAMAAVTVGTTAPPKPPGEYIDDPVAQPYTQQFVYENVYRPTWTKYFWMAVTMDTANGFPEGPGEFHPELWPAITAAGSTVEMTGAAVVGYGSGVAPWTWYVTATIIPQPAEETITFPDSWWRDQGSHIKNIEVYTGCVPEPGQTACSFIMLASALGFYTLRRSRWC